MFANLFDLMQFSAKLINRLRHFQMDINQELPPTDETMFKIDFRNVRLGRTLREMSEELVVFLRCALDYKENRKLLDNNIDNKGFLRYNQVRYRHTLYNIYGLLRMFPLEITQ